MKKEPESLHFQITRSCNLRCWFCGQWGHKGFFKGMQGDEMTLDDWKRVAASLDPMQTDITLWGGEPLVFPKFGELVRWLSEQRFSLGLVTNGVLIDQYAELICGKLKSICVSLDGPEDIHDAIRGKGVFHKVCKNLKLLRGSKVRVTVNTVLSEALLPRLSEFFERLEGCEPDEVLLQDLIALPEAEAEEYKHFLKTDFGIEAKESYPKAGSVFLKQEGMHIPNASFQVSHIPHGKTDRACLSPERRLHVAWNGEVMFCTDFYDFSAGNARSEKLLDIWKNEKSNAFRKAVAEGRNPACNHCSWRSCEHFKL